MAPTLIEPSNKCWLWHRWQLVKNTGATRYEQCKKCGARKATSTGTGYQPVNYQWVLGQQKTL